MKKPKEYSPDFIAAFTEAWNGEVRSKSIARKLGCSIATVSRIAGRIGLPKRPRGRWREKVQ